MLNLVGLEDLQKKVSSELVNAMRTALFSGNPALQRLVAHIKKTNELLDRLVAERKAVEPLLDLVMSLGQPEVSKPKKTKRRHKAVNKKDTKKFKKAFEDAIRDPKATKPTPFEKPKSWVGGPTDTKAVFAPRRKIAKAA